MPTSAPATSAPSPAPAAITARAGAPLPPLWTIPDHELIRCVGRGGYGEVWLARNVVDVYRAVKIVRRSEFTRDDPYHREFRGIQKFMPVSLQHSGLLNLLHVGINEEAGYFYCIMEAADDVRTGPEIVPDNYTPKTLAHCLAPGAALTPRECASVLIPITDGLAHLHDHGLIHRDIKPSNIVFVGHAPKLGDIGLVTEAATLNSPVSLLGTAGYISPEGPGTPAADLFSLGKVIYQMLTLNDPDLFPELPTAWHEKPDPELRRELNRIAGKLCQNNPDRRHQSAKELRDELTQLTR